MRKPNYRIRIEIYDDEVGEVVAREDSFFSENPLVFEEMGMRVMRKFEGNKEDHESTYYEEQE